MNNLQTNALRIAELMGKEINQSNTMNFCYIADYSNYQKLMPIVFECAFSGLIDFEIFSFDRKIFVEIETIDGENPINTEPEFIEALQLACIKYLELKK